MKIKIKVEGKIIERKPKMIQFGNFVMAVVRYKNREYLLKEWEGDEYLRGNKKDYYTLGKELKEGD